MLLSGTRQLSHPARTLRVKLNMDVSAGLLPSKVSKETLLV
jgi:hypothetical protein